MASNVAEEAHEQGEPAVVTPRRKRSSKQLKADALEDVVGLAEPGPAEAAEDQAAATPRRKSLKKKQSVVSESMPGVPAKEVAPEEYLEEASAATPRNRKSLKKKQSVVVEAFPGVTAREVPVDGEVPEAEHATAAVKKSSSDSKQKKLSTPEPHDSDPAAK
jgi:hypothetical protein